MTNFVIFYTTVAYAYCSLSIFHLCASLCSTIGMSNCMLRMSAAILIVYETSVSFRYYLWSHS